MIATAGKNLIKTNIKVPNKDLEALRKNFPHCFDKDGNFQLEKFKNNLTEKEKESDREWARKVIELVGQIFQENK